MPTLLAGHARAPSIRPSGGERSSDQIGTHGTGSGPAAVKKAARGRPDPHTSRTWPRKASGTSTSWARMLYVVRSSLGHVHLLPKTRDPNPRVPLGDPTTRGRPHWRKPAAPWTASAPPPDPPSRQRRGAEAHQTPEGHSVTGGHQTPRGTR